MTSRRFTEWSMGEGCYITLFSPSHVTSLHRISRYLWYWKLQLSGYAMNERAEQATSRSFFFYCICYFTVRSLDLLSVDSFVLVRWLVRSIVIATGRSFAQVLTHYLDNTRTLLPHILRHCATSSTGRHVKRMTQTTRLCKVKRQYLLTCGVSRYCLLPWHGTIGRALG